MDARSLMMQMRMKGPGFTSLNGYTPGSGMTDGQFRDAAGSVTAEDLREVGVASNYRDPFDSAGANPIDPAKMKFDAMMALKKAQSSGGVGAQHAQQRLNDAQMMETGRDEVLRRRQGDFNDAARQGRAPGGSPLTGSGVDPAIAGLTGAAMASQSRAGRPQLSMPREQHDPIVKMQSHLPGLSRARTSY
jgi:hypothetical protein